MTEGRETMRGEGKPEPGQQQLPQPSGTGGGSRGGGHGIASGQNPGGTLPGGGPGAELGSLGTGGGSTGSVKRGGQ